MFERFHNAKDFFTNGTKVISNPRGVHVLEARAYSALRAGLANDGRAVLAALEDELAEMDQSLGYVAEMRERAQRLRRAADKGKSLIQALLTEWREQTIAVLQLGD